MEDVGNSRRTFRDRSDAGRQLAQRLTRLVSSNPVVVGIPRGGVPVAAEVADALHAPLDVVIVRKLGVPFQPELAAGAIGEGGVRVLNDDVIRSVGVTSAELDRVEARERAELERRVELYRQDAPMIPLSGRTVVVIDDGIATGASTRAALAVVRAHGAAHIVLAVPVAPPSAPAMLADHVDEVVVLLTPEYFEAVGNWYDDFGQTSDAEVAALLRASRRRSPAAPQPERAQEFDVSVPVGGPTLAGRLVVPAGACGLVCFAHGSGSSRHSPRNRYVADRLVSAGLATLLVDLLGEDEEVDRRNVFDIDLLARRVRMVATQVTASGPAAGLPLGYFGASTGAAAALVAAAVDDPPVRAVVSRGGRPDLAASHLADVRAPTLLIVGGADDVVLGLNRQAARQLTCTHELAVVPGATHLFEEPGTLEQVAGLAAAWFLEHLR